MSLNVYEVITNRIIDSLNDGVVPWRTPWKTSAPTNLISKKAYRGVNVFLLNASRYSSNYWLTYKQAAQKGGSVRKGEKATPVVFWKVYDNATPKVLPSGKIAKGKAFILRYYSVFNVSQCDGIEAPSTPDHTPFAPIDACERIVAMYENAPSITHGGAQACYSPQLDTVNIPAKEAFETPEAYYSTLFHELAHSTGHKSRLDREGITDPIKFASHKYSFEELVAECTASFLCGEAGVLDTTFDNSSAYIRHWVSKLQSEPKWIVQAGGKAAAAADLILQRKKVSEEEAETLSLDE